MPLDARDSAASHQAQTLLRMRRAGCRFRSQWPVAIQARQHDLRRRIARHHKRPSQTIRNLKQSF
ncbi:hypothetical protein EX530_03465 [Xanthomonas phaseoli]